MKKQLLAVALLALITGLSAAAPDNPEPAKLSGPYLGQIPPGTTPIIFAPGIVSTDAHEFSSCFSPDGNEFYFTRRDPELNYPVVMICRQVNGSWTAPVIAPFVSREFSFEPSVTPDNHRLYFQSGKPIPGQPGPPMNVLFVERDGDKWGEPINPGPPFNPAKAMHISCAEDGTIYTTDISGGPGTECLGVINKVDGAYRELVKLGEPLNRLKQSMHPFISPDGNTLVFGSMAKGQAFPSVLYYSSKAADGKWTEPKEIDLGMNAGQPFITRDGKYLFFTSGVIGNGDIYWVSTEVLRKLK